MPLIARGHAASQNRSIQYPFAALYNYLRRQAACSGDPMLLDEIRQSARALMRVPGLTAISVLTIMLGVGAGTALFTVVKAVLLNPLPYEEPNRLAWIAEINDAGNPTQVAYRNFMDWQEQNRSFSNLAAFNEQSTIVAGSDIPQNSFGSAVTEDFFTVLKARAALGRTFSREEQQAGGPAVIVLSDSLWRRAFGGNPNILGRSVRVLGLSPVVVGVMPAGFSYPEKAEFWMPATAFGDPGYDIRTGHNWRVVGRLKPGIPMERAQEDISAIERRIKQQYPSPFQSKDARVVSLRSHIVGEVRTPLLMLFGAVGFVLLIVCVNIANLLLVRVTAHARELAVRSALGAGRWRLMRQLLIESLVLAVTGGVFGLVLALWSIDVLRILLPPDMPRANNIGIDAGVIAFAIGISAATGLLFGFLPAWRASGMNVNETLKAGSRSLSAGKRSQRTQAALVISEACLSLVLVAGAGLLARSFWNLRSVDPGFRSDHVLITDTQFERHGDENLAPKYRDLLERARSIPGIQAAGIVGNLPIAAGQSDGHFYIEGRRTETGSADAIYTVISPGYLNALRIPLLRGRDFTAQDTENSEPVAIISAEMARVYFAGRDPIGERIWFDSFAIKEHWLRIIGIAADIRESGLTRPSFPHAYTCYSQQPSNWPFFGGTLVMRTAVVPTSLAAPVRAAIRAVNHDTAPVPRTLDSVIAASISKQRFQMEILGAFAVLSLLLAAIGLYGVLSHMVTANRVEIGIRLALGAPRNLIFRMIAGRALALAAFGVAAGLLGCVAVRSVLSKLLFRIGTNDPATLAGAVAVLLMAALAAAWLPARRATRVDPMTVLRNE